MYDCVVGFCAVFSNKLVVASCIMPSDGFASAQSKDRGTSCLYSMKKG